MKVTNDYYISNDLEFKNKKTWNISWVTNKNIKEEVKKDQLSIFNRISNNEYLQKTESEENLYKIKLEFLKKGGNINDISINLFKSKILKDWKMSSWSKLKRNSLTRDVPSKFMSLSPFLEDKSWGYYYSYYSNDNITFNSSGKVFINTLFEFGDIYDINNKVINLAREIYDLKIEVEKVSDKYKIYLILNWKTNKIQLLWYRLFWNVWMEYFAALTSDNRLIFFKTNLNYYFIFELSKKELILDKEEFLKLKEKAEFSYIVENSSNIEALEIEFENIIPELLLKIEIPEDFSCVYLNIFFKYNDVQINTFNLEKEIIVTDWKIIKRDKESELVQIRKLNSLITKTDEYFENVWKKYIDDNLDSFFDEVELLIENGIKVEYKQKTKRITNWSLSIKLKVSSWIDFFDVETKVMLWDKEIEDAKEIMSASRKNSKFITLENWNTIILKNDIWKSTKELDALGINEKDLGKTVQISKHNIWLLRDNKKWDLLSFDIDRDILELKKKFESFKNIEKISQIKDSKIILRDYQKNWFYWINFLREYNFSWILADDMGLWKTIQTLVFLEKIYSQKSLKSKSLIICPTSLVFNWLDEIEKFTPELKTEYIKDGKTWFDTISKDTQLIIVSYWIMANLVDSEKIKETFEYIILDEAQNIKNPLALRSKSISKIKWKYRLALSGTPIENNLVELWSIFNFLMPGFLWNLNHFKSLYSGQDKESLNLLSRKVKPFILRRTKEEVLKDLPPKVEEYIKLEMQDKQKAFYNKLKNTFKLQLEKKIDKDWLNKTRFEVLDALLKLRQACLMPELVNIEWNNLKESIKLEYIDENIEEMITKWHNLLIFSQFTGFLAYVKDLLNKKWIKYNYLDWQILAKNRKALVDSFNLWKVSVFIISLKAWWTWLNLTSADYVIHLDPWWNPAVENQATDRAHRIWQKKTVFVQKLIIKDSIEEKILQLQDNKKKLIEDLFSWDFSWSLDKNDIDFIFS